MRVRSPPAPSGEWARPPNPLSSHPAGAESGSCPASPRCERRCIATSHARWRDPCDVHLLTTVPPACDIWPDQFAPPPRWRARRACAYSRRMSTALDGDVLTALAAQHAELATILEPLDEDAWQRPSRCEGWSVADAVAPPCPDRPTRHRRRWKAASTPPSPASPPPTCPLTNVDAGAELAVQRERGLSELSPGRDGGPGRASCAWRWARTGPPPAGDVGSGHVVRAHAGGDATFRGVDPYG